MKEAPVPTPVSVPISVPEPVPTSVPVPTPVITQTNTLQFAPLDEQRPTVKERTESKDRKERKERKERKDNQDPIVLGIKDPLYLIASSPVKQRMECDEARRLESLMRNIYTSQGGRSRGWTLTGLETYLKSRCASGGNVTELARAKNAFAWDQVVEDKNTSAFLDFICVAQRIRVAVWSDADKSVTVFPAADSSIVEEGASDTIPLYHVYSNGSVKSEPIDSKALPPLCAAMGYAYLPPPSVMKSLAHLSLGELDTLAEKLGFTGLTGSKAQRVVSLAVWKLKQRLLA